MVAEGEEPAVCSTGTQTSRSCTPYIPLLPLINEDKPLDAETTRRDQASNIKLPPALKLGRAVTDLGCESDKELNFLHSDRFSRLFASARALKREKKRSKLSGSLPNLDMSLKEAIKGISVPVASIKDGGASTNRGQRRYHSIADLNNMRNKFTINRYPTSDQIILNGTPDKENSMGKRRKSPVSVGSQTTNTGNALSLTGRNTDVGLEGLLRSDSFKTLDSSRSKNYHFQRSKSSAGEKQSKTNGTTFITSDEGALDIKKSIYKLDSDTQLNNTPRDEMVPLTNVPLLSPGCDSDRMRTPELSKYVNVNGHASERKNSGTAAEQSKQLPNGHPHPNKGVPVIHSYRKSKTQTPKMVLKYYGSELAMKSGVIPGLMPENSPHIRGILSSTSQTTASSQRSGRRVLFKEKKHRRHHELDKRLAATSIVMSADNILVKPELANSLSLTTKNLAIFDEFQDRKIKPLRKNKVVEPKSENSETRVLDWVKARQASQNKIPQIIPLKYSKSNISSTNTAPIAEVDEPEVKALPPPEQMVSITIDE